MPDEGRKPGESWNEFVARLLGAADTSRLQVPRMQVGPQSQVVTEIVGVYGVDDTGTPQHLINDLGELVDPASNKSAYHALPNEQSAQQTGTVAAQVVIPSNQFHEVMGVVASFNADATVVDRTAILRVNVAGRAVATGITTTESLYIVGGISLSLSADQFGLIIADPGSNVITDIDNGAATITADVNNLPRFLLAGDIVEALYSANGQVADELSISLISRRMK